MSAGTITAIAADVSVIICAYTDDRWYDLVAAIDSVREQTTPAREIIVVIDHNERLLARVRAELTGIVTLPNKHERGLSGARNSGLAVAAGAVVAFLDDDASVESDWLTWLVRPYGDPSVLGVGGLISPRWDRVRPTWFPEEFDWVVGCTYRGMPPGLAPVRNLIGANMSFRREVFEATGGFRSGIGRVGTRPVGCEETELCIRARQHWPGRQFLYEPRARAWHRVPAARGTWQYFFSRCYSEGLSKAMVSRFVGSNDSLDAERKHTLVTLPSGALRGCRDFVVDRDPAGLGRAVAIVSGLVAATAGFLVGQVNVRSLPRVAPPSVGTVGDGAGSGSTKLPAGVPQA